jgi:hypothetical protein
MRTRDRPAWGAAAMFIVIVALSFGLGWSIWAAVRSLATAVLQSTGSTQISVTSTAAAGEVNDNDSAASHAESPH